MTIHRTYLAQQVPCPVCDTETLQVLQVEFIPVIGVAVLEYHCLTCSAIDLTPASIQEVLAYLGTAPYQQAEDYNPLHKVR